MKNSSGLANKFRHSPTVWTPRLKPASTSQNMKLPQTASCAFHPPVHVREFHGWEALGVFCDMMTKAKKGTCTTIKNARNQKEYFIWSGMKTRCYNDKRKGYENYGGRGITVCDRWFCSYDNFISGMGPRPSPQHTIDRIDNDLGYSPDNCRWATRREQNNNSRRQNMMTHRNKSMNLTQWARELNMSRKGLTDRFAAGWSQERALSKPNQKKRQCSI